MKKEITKLGIVGAELLAETAPSIIDHMSKKKEEKSFFDKNKDWIYIIILTIFVTKLEYIVIFNSTILDSVINIIYGFIICIILCLFYKEEKKVYKNSTKFIKAIIMILFILGIINLFSHISIAISNLFVL